MRTKGILAGVGLLLTLEALLGKDLTVDPQVLNLGERFNYSVNGDRFEVVNNSDERWTFDAAGSSCSCSKLAFDSNIIEPKARLVGKINFQPTKIGGSVVKYAASFKNGKNEKEVVTFEARATVVEGMDYQPKFIYLDDQVGEFDLSVKKLFGGIEVESVSCMERDGCEMVAQESKDKDLVVRFKIKSKHVTLSKDIRFVALAKDGQKFNFSIPVIDRRTPSIICQGAPMVFHGNVETEKFTLRFLPSDDLLKLTRLDRCVLTSGEELPVTDVMVKNGKISLVAHVSQRQRIARKTDAIFYFHGNGEAEVVCAVPLINLSREAKME